MFDAFSWALPLPLDGLERQGQAKVSVRGFQGDGGRERDDEGDREREYDRMRDAGSTGTCIVLAELLFPPGALLPPLRLCGPAGAVYCEGPGLISRVQMRAR